MALRAQRDRRPGVAALRVNIIESKELSPGGLTPRDSFIPHAPRGTPPALPPPVGLVEADHFELGQVERGVDRAQGDGALGAGVVVGVADWHDPVAIAAGGLEGGWGNVRQHIIAPEPVQQ